jgi:hypothetical protein
MGEWPPGRSRNRVNQLKEIAQMAMPKSIAIWCTILFFLLYGLAQFVPMLMGGFFPFILGILALGIAVFTFLGK